MMLVWCGKPWYPSVNVADCEIPALKIPALNGRLNGKIIHRCLIPRG
jgi:hypothetical protein